MSWISGKRLTEANDLTNADKEFLVRTLLRFFLHGVFSTGEIHADPHPGNFSLIKHGSNVRRLGVYDFGCTRVLKPSEQQTLAMLFSGNFSPTADSLLSLYVNLGFESDLLEQIATHLPRVTTVLLAPFQHTGTFALATWNLSHQIAEILGEDRLTFRIAGPATMIHLIRVFTGIIRYAANFGVDIDWGAEVSKVREMSVTHPPESPSAPADTINIFTTAVEYRTQCLSTSLCVKVEEHGQTKALLKFKPELTESLSDLIPQEVLEVIDKRGINLQEIIEKSRSQRFAPGELFLLQESGKVCRVWLE